MKRAAPEKYHSILLPRNLVGQKRRVFDSNYLTSLHRENLHLTNDSIVKINPRSITTASGKEYPVDIIISANGFLTRNFHLPMKFVNTTRGITLDTSPETGVWAQTGPEAFLGTRLIYILILT